MYGLGKKATLIIVFECMSFLVSQATKTCCVAIFHFMFLVFLLLKLPISISTNPRTIILCIMKQKMRNIGDGMRTYFLRFFACIETNQSCVVTCFISNRMSHALSVSASFISSSGGKPIGGICADGRRPFGRRLRLALGWAPGCGFGHGTRWEKIEFVTRAFL